ncbi:TPA: Paratox [Streptococcus agalactiae]|uniref:competence regulator inhibitor paratox n=1 Tax=Streptococcus agalactiae TaxID=1311 RepID=UPI0013752F44|nr:Paratox [Streptococcus agalactiae]KAF1108183.1 Paratox [Streptococcus agalactiae]KAF1126343.1 Paratox [Streptococcus agalactiae]KAF1138977.1 Paratox [Streptococcus agalactiae]KAF1145428.1 Paratox [Streptococcus agalactiae]KAF1186861.1 Paratox [Streptococcus agalactiae]
MLYIDELQEAIDRGYITDDTVAIVRKNGKIFDYVLPHEEVRDDETVTIERAEEVLRELE